MIGALLGLGTQMYSNALRKLPFMRRKCLYFLISIFDYWKVSELVLGFTYRSMGTRGGMGVGVVFVNQLVKWDAQLKEDLDKMLDKAEAANERRYFSISFLFTNYHLITINYIHYSLPIQLCQQFRYNDSYYTLN